MANSSLLRHAVHQVDERNQGEGDSYNTGVHEQTSFGPGLGSNFEGVLDELVEGEGIIDSYKTVVPQQNEPT